MSTDPTQVRQLVLQGLHEMRRGKVGKALELWQQASSQASDPDMDNPAQAYHDYVKANRIRLAVHLGRKPPVEGQPLELPDTWPAPPAGLCDPPPPPDAPAEPGGATPALGTTVPGEPAPGASAPTPETHDDAAPYGELDLEGAALMVPRELAVNGTASSAEESEPDPHAMHGSDEYAVLEIVVDEDEEDEGPEHEQEPRPSQPEAEPDPSSGALPPPPEALDAPELDLEAPRTSREARPAQEPSRCFLASGLSSIG